MNSCDLLFVVPDGTFALRSCVLVLLLPIAADVILISSSPRGVPNV